MSSDDIYYSELQARHLYDGMEEDLCIGEELLIPGPAGELEVLTSCPDCYAESNPIAVICHPHPLYGGSMRNKVVHILAEAFNSMGLRTVTFNFRGVEKSSGRYDRGVGETEDLAAVVDYFRRRYPEAPLWLAGFSFGAYVALRGHQRVAAERLLLVAPPVTLFDFSALPEVTIPWMVIQGGQDEVIAPAAVSHWLQGREHRPLLRWMADADHFFHGRLNRIREAVTTLWADAAPDRSTA
ncbi:MAG: alpha/beta fold hydrolase [Gammaproteobacteria bacterium]|nr:alpha/beta fold hydrolase [Gammaproteobacteria bacterium]MCW8958120.1 alpha/beta fold hydrolase [Gammaproteobacteria bacterium]MCW8973699.1 alpha/beta fold hydrolase [Gammaproteobacteria bacterium]MCW8993563.1 alpha/beta fold hydrolase [Gammaproteobacteria bacterium]